jgi:putative transposase
MLSSYSQAVNKQQKRSGSLFRNNTKSECVTECNGISPSFFNVSNGTLINRHLSEKEYPKACFDYIHNNPVKAGLALNPEDWEFSSFRDVYGLRNGNLINRDRIEQFGLR